MRYVLLIGALVFSFSFADDGLGGLVRKTEGKKGDHKPAPSRPSDGNTPSRSNDDKGNKPRPAGNQGGSQPANAPSNASDDNPLRKKSRSGAGSANSPQPQQDTGRVPLEGRRVPLEGRPVPFEARPVLTPPQQPAQIQNRPVPMENTTLPALVRRTEGLNPFRWRDRYVIVPVNPGYSSGGFYVDYRFGNLRFGYQFYYIHPEPYRVVYAPYWYYDPCPPFVMVYRVAYLPPRSYPHTVLVETPLYVQSPYYLERRPPDEQQQLLSNLRAAWMLRDPSFIERYVRPNSYIAIYLDGQYAYSLPAEDYIAMTRDALRAVKTEQIRFDRITKRGETQIVVRGEHQYLDEATGIRRIVFIQYTFERVEGRWYLIEAGSSANRL